MSGDCLSHTWDDVGTLGIVDVQHVVFAQTAELAGDPLAAVEHMGDPHVLCHGIASDYKTTCCAISLMCNPWDCTCSAHLLDAARFPPT